MNVYNTRIADLPVSDELKEACAQHGVLTLSQLLDTPVEELTSMPWLSMSMIEELKDMIGRYRRNIGGDGDGRFT